MLDCWAPQQINRFRRCPKKAAVITGGTTGQQHGGRQRFPWDGNYATWIEPRATRALADLLQPQQPARVRC